MPPASPHAKNRLAVASAPESPKRSRHSSFHALPPVGAIELSRTDLPDSPPPFPAGWESLMRRHGQGWPMFSSRQTGGPAGGNASAYLRWVACPTLSGLIRRRCPERGLSETLPDAEQLGRLGERGAFACTE